MSTFPLGSSVALGKDRAVIMFPVRVNVPADCAIATLPKTPLTGHPQDNPSGVNES
jgi:hypothetical protein